MELLHLTIMQKISHYLFPGIIFGFGLIPLYFLFTDKPLFFPWINILISTSFLAIAILSFYKQRKSLQFYSITNTKNKQIAFKACRKILKENGWNIDKQSSNMIQATGFGFRNGIDLRSWSEMLTIIIEKDSIKINSICDPDGHFTQFVSFGKNKQHILDFERLFLVTINSID